ncbi:RNA polymerase sigma factor [Allomuricauda sp. SCSIO 65647]|uniref:RNA polymerase sigma factor n=1 Tax=Allomuricauda sp. SCSIO 65647 TaxID=2908843 RepID=UPI001F3EE362|nr:RNA polymerase sigma factor [Muricauda sp. SCSIO 65647]UJH68022.1 RNA polymerase sigma factor [Muricauda sp. SCSIO 65647]
MTTNNEQALINKIINGDSQSFAHVVDRHKDLVFSLAIRMLKNQEEAEEVSQDTFVKVYTSLKSFKGDSKFSTWIYRIAYNTCLDHIKKNKKRFDQLELNEVTENKMESLQNALDIMIVEERAEMVRSCLDYLSAEDTALLTLFYLEEKNLKEIEKIMKLTVNTLKVRLFRARKKMAEVLLQQLEPEMLSNHG